MNTPQPRRPSLPARAVSGLCMVALACGCFPTPQSARIEAGPKVRMSAAVLAEGRRDDEPRRADHVLSAEFAYGFGQRAEVGLPVVLYADDGFGAGAHRDVEALAMPWVKVSLLPPDMRTALSVSGQAVLLVPANLGLHLGRDMGSWEPQLSLTWIFSPGPAGDSPVVTRYQQAGQFMWMPALAVRLPGARRPLLTTGLLVNHFDEGAVYGDFGQPTMRRTMVDPFVSFSLTF